jgi:hypothetical protein
MIINDWNDPNKGGQELFTSVMEIDNRDLRWR